MPLDPAAQALLEQLAEADMPPVTEMSPPEAREAFAAFADLAGPGEEVGAVEDRTIPGPAGEIPVRIYTPISPGPHPVLVYFHGGGWVLGDIEALDPACRALCNATPIVVVSVDYRLAPEHPFPVPLDECVAATEWVAANAASIGADPTRLAVGGDSAGGNLAAAVCLRARDGGPTIRHQVLIYPVTDHDFGTESYAANGDDYLLTREMMVWFWDHYLSAGADGGDPHASPLRASALGGLPSATVLTAEFDPLRDEGEAYAARLSGAGVAVRARRFDGQIHGFWQMGGVMAVAKEAVNEVAADLRDAMS